jgi:nucleoside-diphosphate kinase
MGVNNYVLVINMERTLSIIKPDAVGNNNIGSIINIFEKAGLVVVAAKMLHLSQMQAEDFYAIHKNRPFFGELVRFMISGPVLVMALQGENAVALNRELMGATNPKEATAGTIRQLFAQTIDENAIHGSDSKENAAQEIDFFFNPVEVCARTR